MGAARLAGQLKDGPFLRFLPWVILVSGLAGRALLASRFPPDPSWRTPPFEGLWSRPPLFDSLRWLLGPALPWLSAAAWFVASATVLVGLAGRVPWRVRLLLAGLLAASPPLLTLGVRPGPQAILAVATVSCWLGLTRTLEGRGRALVLFLIAAASLWVDWFAFCPILAWFIGLSAFPPRWLEPERRTAALGALGAALVVAVPVYALLLGAGADPRVATGWSELPVGPRALLSIGTAVGSLITGRIAWGAPWSQLVPAVLLAWGAVVALRRGVEGDRATWVASVGCVGTWGVAVAMHQWFPAAVDKYLWFLCPLLYASLALGLRPGSGPITPILATLALCGCSPDEDADGHTVADGDCDDGQATTHPGAPDMWDGVDNDCDGEVDISPLYASWEESEPNDTELGGCFAPEGQVLGELPGAGLLATVRGSVDHVVDRSYDDSDRDCFLVRLPPAVDHPRLELHLSWPGQANDLDLAVWGLWEGEMAGFAQADTLGPSPEHVVTTSGFDAGAPLWIWIAPYAGSPVDWTLEMVLR